MAAIAITNRLHTTWFPVWFWLSEGCMLGSVGPAPACKPWEGWGCTWEGTTATLRIQHKRIYLTFCSPNVSKGSRTKQTLTTYSIFTKVSLHLNVTITNSHFENKDVDSFTKASWNGNTTWVIRRSTTSTQCFEVQKRMTTHKWLLFQRLVT